MHWNDIPEHDRTRISIYQQIHRGRSKHRDADYRERAKSTSYNFAIHELDSLTTRKKATMDDFHQET